MTEKQHTIKSPFTVKGKGLHTGLNLTLTVLPAPTNYGYKIQRIDLPGQPVIDAVAENVVDTTRGTVLGVGEARCSTIEHALAAIYAMGIDNILLQVDGPEFPILDGSSIVYVQEINRVGLEEQDAERDYLVIDRTIEVKNTNTGSEMRIEPASEYSIATTIAFNSQILAEQHATLDNMSHFADDMAGARTFVFLREIEPLLMAGLIKGGDLDNAIVIYETPTTQERLDKLCDLTGAEHKSCEELGYIQHKPLVWENECARHKLLDIIGDMSLIGKRIRGHITALRPGHTINNELAREIRKTTSLHQ